MNAHVHTFGLQGTRSVPIDKFVLGVGQTALKPAELVTHVTFDLPGPGWHGTFDKLGLRRAMAIAVASVATILKVDGDRVSHARLALGAVAPTVIRVPQAEDALSGNILDEDTISHVAGLASEAARPIDDVRGSAQYRTMAVAGLVRRALSELQAHIV
jgi:CO/xanthine dehydrogenase FAD-binding subunit